jgi:hypothetical protein
LRSIQTFILRLLLDTEDPHTLRGALRSVADDEDQPFASGESLVDLLHQLTHGQEAIRKDRPSGDRLAAGHVTGEPISTQEDPLSITDEEHES